jgi:hypothetical protein
MQNKMKLKSTIDLVKLPADADELRDRLKRVFSYVTPQIPSNPKVHFGGSCSTPWYFHRRHKIQ